MMRDPTHPQYSSLTSPLAGSATLAGTLGFVALLVGGLLVATYPAVATALVAGALTGSLVRRVRARSRRFRRPSRSTVGRAEPRSAERDLSRRAR